MKGKRNYSLFSKKMKIISGLLLIAAALVLSIYNLHEAYTAGRSSAYVIARMENPDGTGQKEGKLPGENMVIISDSAEDDTEESGNDSQNNNSAGSEEIADYIINPDMDMPKVNVDGTEYIARLEIPKLQLKLPVAESLSYTKLKTSPCRYTGSAYKDDMVIAAHNYKAHFGELAKLEEGDAVILKDMDGNVFRYEVALKEELKATAVEEMKESDYALTLFTCTSGGYARFTVRCRRA